MSDEGIELVGADEETMRLALRAVARVGSSWTELEPRDDSYWFCIDGNEHVPKEEGEAYERCMQNYWEAQNTAAEEEWTRILLEYAEKASAGDTAARERLTYFAEKEHDKEARKLLLERNLAR